MEGKNFEAGKKLTKEQEEVEEVRIQVRYIRGQDAARANKLIADFGTALMEKYPDYEDYALYHALSGSGINPERGVSKHDFPGEDSVVEFMKKTFDEFVKTPPRIPSID
ncbi:MAG: hypothetical protein PHF50_01900 [Patescibacteria group bacterium]|nr:hypothetical protein [Patescibacteria group bacterium]